jgi:CHASE3 domain sensor protein
MKRLQKNSEIQVHTKTVIFTLKDHLNFLLVAETMERGFVINADKSCLKPYNLTLHKISINTNKLRKLFSDNPNQQQNLDTLSKFVVLKISFTNKLFSLKKQGDERTIKKMLLSNKSKYFMDNIQAVNRSMQQIEDKLLTERQLATQRSIAEAKKIFIIGFILSLLITNFLIITVIIELSKRSVAEEKLFKTNEELEIKNKNLESKTNFIAENEKRITNIMAVLIKTTRLDFSEKLSISDRGDELDAIALGLNTMSEELEYHLSQLKRSQEELNNAQRLANIGNWDLNIIDNTLNWSDELYRIYGMSQESFEANYENYLECIHPEDREYVNAIIQKAYN